MKRLFSLIPGGPESNEWLEPVNEEQYNKVMKLHICKTFIWTTYSNFRHIPNVYVINWYSELIHSRTGCS